MSLLRNRATGGVLVMLTVIVLILLLGRQFRLSLVIQLVAIIAVLLIGMIVLVIGYMRANKSSSAIEQSIRVQAEQQAQSVRPDKQAEIKQLQEELDRAITKLKQSKLGGGRRGRAALYALPWYMMIGPPAAGKTTAIANSGLSFPIGLDAIRGVGGTRNCDWFFSDSAIILDTAGRYVTEPEDQEEWNAFLETLRTNRRRQPINGVIVAISIDELADATADQIDRHAVTIRRKIDDLVTRLDVKFPVYLMFTKCDLLRGFVQFFGELGRQERERVWGCTLDRIRSQEEEVGALFEKETDRLFQHLVNMRSARLARAMKREDRQLVYVFPLEFASVKDKLKGFVSRLFQPNPYQESPTFRGFYFSSGTQEGIPIDRVIRVIAEKFEFVGAPLQDEEPVKQTKSYFIKDLFTRVVIPDRYLVSQTSRAAVRGSFMKAGVGIAAVVLLGLFILGAGQALVRSQIRLNRVAEVATEAAPVQADVPVLAGEDLGRLENLRVVLADLEDEPLFGWGLDQRDEVREPVRTIFYGKMRQTIGTGAFRLLQSRARSALQGARLDEVQKEQLYDDFKTYLLMTRAVHQLQDDASAEYLKRQLTGLSDSIRTRASRSAAGNDEGATARGLVEAFVDGLRAGHAQPFEHDELLVTRVERIISEPISAERLYARLKRSGEEALGTYSLYSDVLDGLNVDFFALDRQIPAVFTQDGWDGFVENRIETESEDPNRDDWVIASRDVSPESETSSNEVHNRMTNLYMEEYGATWHAFLTGIEYQALRDVDAAARRLISLGDPDRSPILYILAKATYNTFGSGSLMDQATEQLDGDGSSNPVKRRFKALHELNAPGAATGTADASLIQALSVLGRLGETLESIKTDGSRIAELAADVIDQRGGELATAREEIRSSLSTLHPSIRDQLFDRPIVLAWQAILNSSQDYLNQRWQDEVYDEFRSKLAGRFPVDQASITDDVPIDDFERFFRPAQGTISSFYAEVLEPFLRDDMRTSRTWLNQGIAISAVTSDALNGADRIGEALFEGEALRLTFELTPELPNYANANAPRASQYNIDVHGQMSTYTMGRPISSTIQWPGSPDARLRVSTQQGELDPIQYSGHWAWFKLIRAADRTRVNSTQYEFRWDVGRGVVARYNVSTRQAANPFADTRSFFEIRVPSRLD